MAYMAYKQVIDAAESFGATAKEAPGTVRFVVQHGCPKYAKARAVRPTCQPEAGHWGSPASGHMGEP